MQHQKHFLFFLLTGLLGLFICYSLANVFVFTTDDAYITLRYAQNWVSFGKLDWNINNVTPVEGYSRTLYLLLSALAFKSGMDQVIVLNITGIIAFLVSLIVLFYLVSRHSNRWIGIIAVALFASYPGAVWWAVSGLETPVYVLLFLSCLTILDATMDITDAKRRHTFLFTLSFLTFLSGITRPEGPIIGLFIAGVLFLRSLVHKQKVNEMLHDLIWLAAPFLLFYGIYFSIRYAHFGKLWPNTFYCKSGYAEDMWFIIKMYLISAKFPLIIGIFAFFSKHTWRIAFILFGFIVLNTALYFGVDPMVAHLNRHTIISMALTYGICALGMHIMFTKRRALGLVFCIIFLSWQISLGIFAKTKHFNKKAIKYHARMQERTRLADFLLSISVKNYAIGDAGIVPYLTQKVTVYDYYGLNSLEFVSTQIDRNPKKFAKWLYKQAPDAVVVSTRKPGLPRDETQKVLFGRFTEENGYQDQGVQFGAERDSFQYRVLLKK